MMRCLQIVLFLAVALLAASQTPRPAVPPGAKPAQDSLLYRNAAFGFRYQIRYGWVDRTKEMREQEPADAKAEKLESKEKAASAGEVLLAVFERPPEAVGETVNSAVVIVAEKAEAYPGLKKAEDYLGPLTELATAKGFKPGGDPMLIEIDGRQLVRADFTRPVGSTKDDKLIMRQSTLVMLTKGQIVSLTFIAGSEDEIDDLIDGLHFGLGH